MNLHLNWGFRVRVGLGLRNMDDLCDWCNVGVESTLT